jgi:hypothetical protein
MNRKDDGQIPGDLRKPPENRVQTRGIVHIGWTVEGHEDIAAGLEIEVAQDL